MSEQKVRHILSLSGGKDSTALAIYMRDRVPDLEYVFCDTEKELPETYEYLDRVEAYLGQPIVRLKHDGRGFDHLLAIRSGFLPSPRNRWCTEYLKLKPFERYVAQDDVVNYVGIRADEDREGYISHKPNIAARYPFKEDGLVKADVVRLLELSGLGLPEYYKWRSRSGCYFCFYQQKIEWVGRTCWRARSATRGARRRCSAAIPGRRTRVWGNYLGLRVLRPSERSTRIA
jgi:hypothetical protein